MPSGESGKLISPRAFTRSGSRAHTLSRNLKAEEFNPFHTDMTFLGFEGHARTTHPIQDHGNIQEMLLLGL